MVRRRFVVATGLLLPIFIFIASLLVSGQQAFALGGTLPALQQPAPQFRLAGVQPSVAGEVSEAIPAELALADFAGQWLVLYFYPRDFTGGCTIEARGFQKDLPQYKKIGAQVVGISADDPESHAEFCSSEGLAFPLLSDPGGAVSRSYGSWIAPYSQRHTFLIDPNGILREQFVAVRPSGHSDEVLTQLRALQAEPIDLA
ncbi:peroxiredoxin [Cyanobium sp. WAJ14-Wanaka]|nr:peroxiredoxin [Cyanobium sp. WAJ14-Wanaka]MCP9774496.1 peroxiredoxin [Cyanobium sp. WAJ14-Wanaka]